MAFYALVSKRLKRNVYCNIVHSSIKLLQCFFFFFKLIISKAPKYWLVFFRTWHMTIIFMSRSYCAKMTWLFLMLIKQPSAILHPSSDRILLILWMKPLQLTVNVHTHHVSVVKFTFSTGTKIINSIVSCSCSWLDCYKVLILHPHMHLLRHVYIYNCIHTLPNT